MRFRPRQERIALHLPCTQRNVVRSEGATRALLARAPLLAQLAASGATRLLSANIGCRLHFANGTRLPVQHPLEFLAESLAGPTA